MEKEFEIDWQGSKEKVVIKRLSFGEKNALVDSFMRMKMVGTQLTMEVSYKDMVEFSIVACVTKSPFDHTKLEVIQQLEPQVGEAIYKEIEALNGSLPESKKSS